MPLACSSAASALSGADGLVTFKPAGVKACLLDHTDFPSGSDISVPSANGFRVGDSVKFTVAGTGKLDTALTAGDAYFVTKVDPGKIQVSATSGGTAVTLNGDGGTGTADTAGSANHIELDLADYVAVCSVSEWSLSLSKDQADVTTLPCSVGKGGSKVAPVRKQKGTFLNGEGSMSILFTDDATAMGQRLLADSVMVDSVVDAKLYINAVSGAATVDDAQSSYFEGRVTLLGFSISVNTSDALVAEVNFSLAESPKALFGVTL